MQESRTLEMNNVQDGIWHGRGDTICISTYGDGGKAFVEVNLPALLPTKSPDPCSVPKVTSKEEDHTWEPNTCPSKNE